MSKENTGCCVPTRYIDPLLIPATIDMCMSPAQQLAWCIKKIEEMMDEIEELKNKVDN